MKNNSAALFFLSSLILGCGSVNTNKSNSNDQINSSSAKVENKYEELKIIAEKVIKVFRSYY